MVVRGIPREALRGVEARGKVQDLGTHGEETDCTGQDIIEVGTEKMEGEQ